MIAASCGLALREAASRARRALGRADRQLLSAAARGRNPITDPVLTTASGLANRSKLWLVWAAALAVTGRREHRTAAASGLLGVAFASAVVNGPLKFVWHRDRPPTAVAPLLPLPRTFSFPSGHAASAFAFAIGARAGYAPAGDLAVPAAALVAYSRVHTGVHYPSDVVVGAGVGAASGVLAAQVVHRVRRRGSHRVDSPALDMPVPRDVVLLSSPAAGTADALEAAREALAQAGFTLRREIPINDLDWLTDQLRGGGRLPLVVAAGGDGTVGAAAGAIGDSGALLAILPLGTSNDVARSVGVPVDPVEAALGLAQASVHEVDAGRVHTGDGAQRLFLHAATTGVNVAFARVATRRSMRDRFGGLTYPVAAAVAIRRFEPFRCTLKIGTAKTEAPNIDAQIREVDVVHLSVSNAPVFGGPLGMRVPRSSMTDGLLDVIVVERLSLARLSLAVADTFVGRHTPVHRVSTYRTRTVEVDAPREHQVAVDGEVFGGAPFRFEAVPRAVRVVVPRHAADR